MFSKRCSIQLASQGIPYVNMQDATHTHTRLLIMKKYFSVLYLEVKRIWSVVSFKSISKYAGIPATIIVVTTSIRNSHQFPILSWFLLVVNCPPVHFSVSNCIRPVHGHQCCKVRRRRMEGLSNDTALRGVRRPVFVKKNIRGVRAADLVRGNCRIQ